MNTKFKFSAIAFGVALATTSLSALAANGKPPANPAAPGMALIIAAEADPKSTAPSFNATEQAGIALVESALSLIAAYTDHYGCDKASYGLAVYSEDAYYPASSVAEIDDGDVVLNGILSGKNTKGVKVDVKGSKGDALKRAGVVYTGKHAWNKASSIFLDTATIDLIDRQNKSTLKYDEHSIKDYFKQVISGHSWEFDWGLEVITKNDYPRAKWTELSWYSKENGGDGYIRVVKQLIKPGSASGCTIEYIAEGSNESSEFGYVGEVTVSVQRAVTPTPPPTEPQ